MMTQLHHPPPFRAIGAAPIPFFALLVVPTPMLGELTIAYSNSNVFAAGIYATTAGLVCAQSCPVILCGGATRSISVVAGRPRFRATEALQEPRPRRKRTNLKLPKGIEATTHLYGPALMTSRP
jgi:hypothetical protein